MRRRGGRMHKVQTESGEEMERRGEWTGQKGLQYIINFPSCPSQRLPYSLVGQDIRLSPERPGFESLWRNPSFVLFACGGGSADRGQAAMAGTVHHSSSFCAPFMPFFFHMGSLGIGASEFDVVEV